MHGGPVSDEVRPTRTRRFWSRLAQFATAEAGEAPEPVPDQPPEHVLDLLRRLGVALCQAGEAVDRVGAILEDVAAAYDARHVRFFVLPTGVFVRLEVGDGATIDFAPGSAEQLRLDQVDALYRLIDEIRRREIGADAARARLDELLASTARFGPVMTILGSAVLTVGLGLILNPTASALPAYPVLGVLCGILAWLSLRSEALALILTVATAFTVSWAAFRFAGPLLDAPALDIVIPSLVTLLPGAALTIATIELSSGSIISGSTRLVFGLERLLLLTFGIAMGAQVAGLTTDPIADPEAIGRWGPWVGVLFLGIGHYLYASAPRRTLGWMLLTLYIAYGAQVLSGEVLGSLGSCFVAGAVIVPVAYAVQAQRNGPPAQVMFLPAFWLLVPGALGLEGVTEIIRSGQGNGIGELLNALLSVVAIAVGILIGSSVTDGVGRRTRSWRGL